MNFKQFFNELYQADAVLSYAKIKASSLLKNIKEAEEIYLKLIQSVVKERTDHLFDVMDTADSFVIPSKTFRNYMSKFGAVIKKKSGNARWANSGTAWDPDSKAAAKDPDVIDPQGKIKVPSFGEPWEYAAGEESVAYFYTNDKIVKFLGNKAYLHQEFYIASKLKGKLDLLPILDAVKVTVTAEAAQVKELYGIVMDKLVTENMTPAILGAAKKASLYIEKLLEDIKYDENMTIDEVNGRLSVSSIKSGAKLSKPEESALTDLFTITKEILKETGYIVGADYYQASPNIGKFKKKSPKGVALSTFDLGRGQPELATYDVETRKPKTSDSETTFTTLTV